MKWGLCPLIDRWLAKRNAIPDLLIPPGISWAGRASEPKSPASGIQILQDEEDSVKVKAVELYNEDMSRGARKHLARRSKISQQYLMQLIQTAKQRVAIEVMEWD